MPLYLHCPVDVCECVTVPPWEKSSLFSLVSYIHCVYTNVQLSLRAAFYVWATLSSLPQFPKRAQKLCDALSYRVCFLLSLNFSNPFKVLLPWKETLELRVSLGHRQFLFSFACQTLTPSCKAGYDTCEIHCTGKKQLWFQKQNNLTPCHPLSTILEPAEACQQCLWGQVNRESGEETIGGAKPKGITCNIPSDTLKLRDLGHLVIWMHRSWKLLYLHQVVRNSLLLYARIWRKKGWGRMVAPPSSPGIPTREAVRAYLPKHSLVPSEAQGEAKGGETGKGEQYLLPASKTHLY